MHMRELGSKAGADAVALFEKGLRAIYSPDRRSYGSSLWRPAIESNSQIATFTVRKTALSRACAMIEGGSRQRLEQASEYIGRALSDDLEIIRRIALHAVTEHSRIAALSLVPKLSQHYSRRASSRAVPPARDEIQ